MYIFLLFDKGQKCFSTHPLLCMQTPHIQTLLYATIFFLFVFKNGNHGKSLAFILLFFLWTEWAALGLFCWPRAAVFFWGEIQGKGSGADGAS